MQLIDEITSLNEISLWSEKCNIFESFDDLTIDDIEIDLVETINKYMPEITLVKLNKITIDEHHLQIDVFYTYKGINNSVEKIELVF